MSICIQKNNGLLCILRISVLKNMSDSKVPTLSYDSNMKRLESVLNTTFTAYGVLSMFSFIPLSQNGNNIIERFQLTRSGAGSDSSTQSVLIIPDNHTLGHQTYNCTYSVLETEAVTLTSIIEHLIPYEKNL